MLKLLKSLIFAEPSDAPVPLDAPLAMYSAPRSPEWPEFREAFLKEHPTCEACGTNQELQVHHVLPFRDRPDLEMVEENCMTLCMYRAREDHWQLGHLGLNWSINNPHVREDAARMLQRRQEAQHG